MNWLTRLRKPFATVGVLGALLALAIPHQASESPRLQPVASAVQTAPRQPAPAGNSLTQIGNPENSMSWIEDPFGWLEYVYRMSYANGIGLSTGRNIAISFIDITGLKGLDTSGYQVVDSASLKTENPALYNKLDLANRPAVKQFVIVPKAN